MYAGAAHDRERGWRQLTGANQLHGLLNLGRLGPRAGARLQAFAANGYAETAGSLPLSVYRVNPDSNLSAGDFEDIVQLHVALSAWRPLGAGRSALALWFRASDAERFNVNQEDDPDVRSFSDNRSLGASADWRLVREAGVGTLALRVGAGGSANRSRVEIHAERIDPGLTTDIESPIGKLDAYGLADWVVGPLTLSGGLRWDAVRIPFRNRLDGARDTTSTFRHLSPRGGASLAVGALSIYISAGRSFRPPALIELACADPNEPCPLPFALGDDPPLAPVVATTLEIGGRWTVGAAELTGAAYRTGVRDDIFLFPYDDAGAPSGSTIDGFFANIARTRRQGVELGARVAAGPVALRASWATTRATFQVDGIEIFSIREESGAENEVEKGDRMPLVPAHTAALGATVALPYGLSLGAGLRYTGERVLRGDEANEEPPLDGVWLADVRAGARIAPWEVGVVVENVLDAEYEAFGTFNINQGAGDVLERFLSPGTPRAVRLVVRRRLGP